MSTAYVESGRTNQKQRTRSALVTAARDLIAQGVNPTVEEAAAAAAISRTTAYRYFPSQAALLVAAHPEVDTATMLPPAAAASDDPAVRLDAVVEAFTRLIADTEPQQRTMLRLSLEPDRDVELPLRQGRAIAWLEEALDRLGRAVAKPERRR